MVAYDWRSVPCIDRYVVLVNLHVYLTSQPLLCLGCLIFLSLLEPKTASRLFATTPSTTESKLPALHELGSVDHGYEDDRIDRVAEPERRAFTYLMLSTLRFAYASTARLLVVKFGALLSPSADVLALAFAEFDLTEVPLGETLLVNWRGKPIYIRHRTAEEIAEEAIVPMSELRDQELDSDRCIKPEFSVVLGICVRLLLVEM
jgi:Ubiquinol cytochrome reductase transmembrane region